MVKQTKQNNKKTEANKQTRKEKTRNYALLEDGAKKPSRNGKGTLRGAQKLGQDK